MLGTWHSVPRTTLGPGACVAILLCSGWVDWCDGLCVKQLSACLCPDCETREAVKRSGTLRHTGGGGRR